MCPDTSCQNMPNPTKQRMLAQQGHAETVSPFPHHRRHSNLPMFMTHSRKFQRQHSGDCSCSIFTEDRVHKSRRTSQPCKAFVPVQRGSRGAQSIDNAFVGNGTPVPPEKLTYLMCVYLFGRQRLFETIKEGPCLCLLLERLPQSLASIQCKVTRALEPSTGPADTPC